MSTAFFHFFEPPLPDMTKNKMLFPIPSPLPSAEPTSQAQWIWTGASEPNSYALFHTTFDLKSCDGILLKICAVNRYRVWINGHLLGDGPPPSQPAFSYADTYPISEVLNPGHNRIVALVHFVGRNTDEHPGLWAEILGSDGRVITATSPEWGAQEAAAWKKETFFFRMNFFDPYQEVFDSRIMDFPPLPSDDNSGNRVETTARPRVSQMYKRTIPFLWHREVMARRIQRIEECTWLENRIHPHDLSINLSRPGRPLRQAVVKNPVALTSRGAGETCTLQCSTSHLTDPSVGKVYEPFLTLDFKHQINACLEVEVEGPLGAALDFGFAEQLVDGHFNNSIEGQFSARFILRGGRQTWRMFSWRSWRFLRIRVSRSFTPLTIHRLVAVTEEPPHKPLGKLTAGDAEIAGIYKMARETVKIASGEIFFDSPWREQVQWLGDIAAVGLDAYHAIYGDLSLPSKFLFETSRNQNDDGLLANLTNSTVRDSFISRPLADYSLHWLRALWRFYLLTGSRTHLQEHYSAVLGILSHFRNHLGEKALLENFPSAFLIDWANLCRSGISAPINALFAHSLDFASRIANIVGDAKTESWCLRTRRNMLPAFAKAFWSKTAKCFLDGVGADFASEHTNALAILSGLATPKQTMDIVRSLFTGVGSTSHSRRVVEAQPFFSSFVLEALDLCGRFDLALHFLRERWGRRMLEQGLQTTGEEWSPCGTRRTGEFEGVLRSCSHIWSAAPAHFLPTSLLGLKIISPGCSEIRLSPKTGYFDFNITYPLPTGLLRVSCKNDKVSIHPPSSTRVVPESNCCPPRQQKMLTPS